jgi:O-Antigen ligase
MAGITYAYIIGVWSVGPVPATFGLLTWLVPVIFGFHLAATWRRYEFWREATRSAFACGAVVLAAYGLIQFTFVPAWDGFWMSHAGMSSIGRPLPFQVRVFSTLNAPGVFAIFLMAGLLVGFSRRATLSGGVAQPVVWLGFLLSQVRSAWLGYGVGLALLLVRTPLSRSLKLLAAGALLLLAILPLVQIEAVERVAMPRIMSLGQLGSDHSLRERMQLYGRFFDVAAGNIPGSGIGSTNLATKLSNNGQLTSLGVIDSGMLEILFVFGWPGSLLYALGVGLAMVSALWGWSRGTDPFIQAARAVVAATLLQIVFFNPLGGAVGMIFWSFLGLILAGRSYHDGARKVAG